MPILDLQRRGRQIGEIRLGNVVISENGKPRPSKLDAFRFTTKSESIARAVAELLGGTAQNIKLQNGTPTWEVLTDVTELPVMVPPGENVISQWWELYSAAGCARRCDGVTEQLTQSPCMCPADQNQRRELATRGSACKPTTRLNLMLPDLPDLGVWLLTSRGFNAAVELGGTAEVLAAARNANVIIPAVLRLEQRESRTVGHQVKKFAVAALELRASVREMTELRSNTIESALPPKPVDSKAIGSGDVNLWDYLVTRITSGEERTWFRDQHWSARFSFPTTVVPSTLVEQAKQLIDEHASKTDDDIVEAEIVEPQP